MRATDMLFAIPAILLALAIVTALGPGWLNSALAIGIGYIPIFVRVVRAPVLAFARPAMCGPGGCSVSRAARLLFRHILPNVAGIVAVQTSLALAWSILAEASLSFLGLGPPPPTASLGEMVQQLAVRLAATAWWTLAAPSVAIVIAVIGFNFLGDGLRDAVDPAGDGPGEEPNVRVIGMISGTSFDAVEALLVELELDGEDARLRPAWNTLGPPIRRATQTAIAAILPPAPTTIEQVCRLDIAIGQFFAEVAKEPRRRVTGRSTSSARTARPSTTGSRARRPRHSAAGTSRPGSPSGPAPPSSATCATATSPRAATGPRWRACWTSCCWAPPADRCAARSTSAGSPM